MAWIAKQPEFAKVQQLEVSTRFGNMHEAAIIIDDEGEVDEDDRGASAFVRPRAYTHEHIELRYIPANSASYKMWYKGRWMEITREKSTSNNYYER
jgi:hypothetical protein